MRWSSILLLSVLLAGCDADLKEQANEFEAEIATLESQVRVQEAQIHDLERQLDTCEKEVARKAVNEILAEAGIAPDSTLHAVLHTDLGDIRIELLPNIAPRTVANFVGLAEGTRDWTDPRIQQEVSGVALYRDTTFHRVIPGYIVQCGDPLGTGFGGPGYAFPDELSDEIFHTEAGMVSMANSGPDTNGSQFFITLEPARHLDTKHTLFGTVVEGLDVAQAISEVPAGSEVKYRPDRNVMLRSVTIQR